MIKNSTLSALFLWIIILASYSFASDNYYLLKRGATAWDGGKLSEAIGYYQEYIDNHPATTNLYSEAYERRKQYYLRNLLIAYKKILLINQQAGDQASRSLWLDRLEALAAQGVMGAKNLYQAGWIMHKNERDDKAASIFEKIITEQCETYNPLHNKVLLRSCSKLIQIYEQKGESIKQMNLLKTIQKKFPTKDFDPRDLYQLANLYHVYGVNDEAIKLLNQIAAEDDFNLSSPFVHARMNAYTRLLEISYQEAKAALPISESGKTINKWIDYLSKNYPPEILPANLSYKLAVKYLKCDHTEDGVQLLKYISRNHPNGATGRKALFLLGRVAQSQENWDEAIKYFETYIQQYPDPLFFALKAYSRLIDAYWSKDANLKMAQKHASLLADIVNQIADYETQLNLARDLKWKGMDQLAAATFNLGANAGEKEARMYPGTYKALRIRWLLTKYALAVDRFDIAEQNGKMALTLAQQLGKENKGKVNGHEEKTEYIESQIYLWLSKIYENQERYSEAEPLLRTFMDQYPDDRECGYAGYTLGKVLEKLGRYQDSVDAYSAVTPGMWKEKARKRMIQLSSDNADL